MGEILGWECPEKWGRGEAKNEGGGVADNADGVWIVWVHIIRVACEGVGGGGGYLSAFEDLM